MYIYVLMSKQCGEAVVAVACAKVIRISFGASCELQTKVRVVRSGRR